MPDMSEEFTFDVFLSLSSKDKDVVRPLAERLRADGLKVWFDEWVLKPGDSIPAKIDEGLEHSRVLVLCMSANAFGSDWAQLEAGTFRFRDPLNKERRFIPLRLDDIPIEGTLAQFLYINWLPAGREQEYAKLFEGCRPPKKAEAEDAAEQLAEKSIQLDYEARILAHAFSPDRKQMITGGENGDMKLWDLESGQCRREFEGHSEMVRAVAWSASGGCAFSGSWDGTMRMWNMETGSCVRVFEHDGEAITSVTGSSDEKRALSGSLGSIRVWDLETGQCLIEMLGGVECLVLSADQHQLLSSDTMSSSPSVKLWDVDSGKLLLALGEQRSAGYVFCVAWSSDQRRALSGGSDTALWLWDLEKERSIRVLEGHTSDIRSVAWNADNRLALSGSKDNSVRLWDTESGRCLRVLKGHTDGVMTVAWSADGRRAFSGDQGGGIRVWDLSEFVTVAQALEATSAALSLAPDQVQYTNAKVLLVGDSGVGKSGLSNYLAHSIKVEDDKPLSSTDGAWATHWPLRHSNTKTGVEREIWLWDFAGQVDYRLVHQLYMDDTAAAVLVFNPQNENPFEGLGQWDRDLRRATRKPFGKLLAAGRVDRGGLVVSAASMKKFMNERGFIPPLRLTSAKTGEGCDDLREAIVRAIDWQGIPETTSPALYHRLKQEILNLRDSGLVLIRLAELNQRMEMTLREEKFELAELEAVVRLLAGPGMIQRLDFGGFILLRPEVLSRYAAALVRKVRQHPQEMGCIREDEFLAGDLDYQDFARLPREDETVVLRALHETAVKRAWCLRQDVVFEGERFDVMSVRRWRERVGAGGSLERSGPKRESLR